MVESNYFDQNNVHKKNMYTIDNKLELQIQFSDFLQVNFSIPSLRVTNPFLATPVLGGFFIPPYGLNIFAKPTPFHKGAYYAKTESTDI